jgi:hypothetical protein
MTVRKGARVPACPLDRERARARAGSECSEVAYNAGARERSPGGTRGSPSACTRMDRRKLLALFLAAAPLGCAAPHGKGPQFPLEVSADHFVGSLRTGALAGPDPAALGDPWWIDLRITYAPAPPSSGTEVVSSRAGQVFVERAGHPLATRSELALGILATDAPAVAAPDAPVLARRDPLWPGTTTLWRAAPRPELADAPFVRWQRAEVELSRPAGAEGRAELALVFEGEVRARGEDEERSAEDRPAAAGGPELQREHLVLEADPFASGGAARFFVPAPRRGFPSGGYAIEIARSTASGDDVERGRAELARSLARAREGASRLSEDEGFRFESGTALPALERPGLRRSALVFLSQVARAPLAGDLALDADADALASYVATLAPLVRSEQGGAEPSPALGWALERAAYAWLAAAALDEKHPLAPELLELLLAHAGELGRFPGLLRDAVQECDGLPALDRRLIQENRIFLEDADPAARLRAFEWLEGRGAAPAGFDPLGALAERRAALDRAREAAGNGEKP